MTSTEFGCQFKGTASTHVHVNAVKRELNGGSVGYEPLETHHIANVFLNYMEFQLVINQMLPADRRKGLTYLLFGKRNCVKDLNGSLLDNLFATVVNDARSGLITRTAANMSRYRQLNLRPLGEGRYGTFEFRGYGATPDSQKVEMWVRFCVLFV